MARIRPFINNNYNYHFYHYSHTTRGKKKKQTSFGILIHFLMDALCFPFKKGCLKSFYFNPLITRLSRLPRNEKVSFLNVLWTCVPATLAERLDIPGLLSGRAAGAPPTCETRSCGLFFHQVHLTFLLVFFLSSTLKSTGLFSKIKGNGVISLWALIVWNRLRSTLALASRQQLQTDNCSQMRITDQRERKKWLVFIYLCSQGCVCV